MREKVCKKNRFAVYEQSILTMRVDAIASLTEVITHIRLWLQAPKGHYICLANVHTCMEAYDRPSFRQIVNHADMVLPDGRPLLWGLKLFGHSTAIQVRGFDLMLVLFAFAQQENIPIGFLGGTQEDLDMIRKKLCRDFPDLEVVCTLSPPFYPLTQEEDTMFIEKILTSGTRILFVFLGCPKQERWMAAHKDRLPCIMIGAGAALDFYIGKKKQAPRFMQKAGFEWFFRLLCEPRRLWKRYAKNNPRFIVYFLLQWLRQFNTSKISHKKKTSYSEKHYFS